MASNLSILDRNILHGFEAYSDADACEDMYLRHRHLGVEAAEKMANDWGALSEELAPMLAAACRPFETLFEPGDYGVRDFIRVRFENFGRPQ